MTARESEMDRLTRRVRGAQAIEDACVVTREFGAAQWLDEDEQARLSIIVEEWVTNLYDHGGLKPDDEVELRLSYETSGIRIVIVDPGPPFDPRNLTHHHGQSERGGGAGIPIMRAWAEMVNYRSSEDGNHMEMFLPLK